MAKQLNVSLAFTADTGKAKAQLKDLQNQLTQVINLSSKDVGGDVMARDIEKASLAAAQLKAHLEDATNVKTGKLDLGKLSEALDTKKLKSYRNSLQAIGVEGQKAFMMLAQSITDAELPLRRTSNLMSELWVTVKNTARWQFTSSAMHGFMSAVSGAYGYAQDLNESLNNIRIVSGQSTEEMAKFAEQANKAAKALSTTTTSYTNAALIYYQQGLSESEIKERTDITIKMANVARQSAEVVSDQLTAVWNNFYKEGEDSLARYADIMTALGAETASSTDEIAAGLEKFASIADMIGLSFEYAASSLATITATTRQSPEVVGTALKTIFARIQGLKLGETLEDGTDLNKYSDSLKRVGIEIFDTAGELKDMDIILEEIGNRWDQLGKSEQVALAQAVAGVRQYNQLVSLMDHWDYFQENLNITNNAEGVLDEQAKIYEESWEAASNRVRAALESLYSEIINDEAFIGLLNSIEKIITGVDHLIDSIGGLGGVLSALGVISTKVFHEQMTASLKNIAYSADMTFGLGQERANELRKTAWKETEKFEVDTGTFEGTIKADLIRDQSILQQSLIENSSKMSQEEIRINQILLDRQKILTDIVGQRANEITKLEEAERKERKILERQIMNDKGMTKSQAKEAVSKFKNQSRWSGRMMAALDLEENSNKKFNQEELKEFFAKYSEGGEFSEEEAQVFLDEIFKGKNKRKKISADLVYTKISGTQDRLQQEFQEKTGVSKQQAEAVAKKNHEIAEGYIEVKESSDKASEGMKELSEKFYNAEQKQKSFSDVVVSSANRISGLVFSINALSGAFEILQNPDMAPLEKFASISMSLLTIFPILTSAIEGLSLVRNKENLTIIANTGAQIVNTMAIKANIAEVKKQGQAINDTSKEIIENTENWTKQTWLLLWGLIKKALPIIGVFAAIATAIGIVIKNYKDLQANSPEGQLENIKQKAEDASKAFNNISIAVNEIISGLDGLESSRDKIENLTKDTLEWHQAVSEVNAEVLKLSEKIPELELTRDENGILGFTEESIKKVKKDLTNELVAAENNALIISSQEQRAQQVVNRQEYDTSLETSLGGERRLKPISYGDMEYANNQPFNFTLGYKYTPQDILQVAEQIYADPLVSDQLFTDTYLEEWAGMLEVNSEALKELIISNEGLITERKAESDRIKATENMVLSNHINSYNSNMTPEELMKDIKHNGESFDNYGDYLESFKKEIELDEQDYKNYTDSIEAEFVEAKEGKVYYKTDDSETNKPIDIETLKGIEANKLAGEELYKQLVSKAKENVNALAPENSVLSRTAYDKLSDENYIQLDNLQRDIADYGKSLGWTEEETIQNQKAIQSTLRIEKGEFSEEELNERLSKWGNIDTSSAENLQVIERAIQDLNESANNTEGVEKFTHTMDKLATQAQIDDMSAGFETAGKSFGLNDEEVDQMQDYAKYISDISEESEELSDNLATDAEASADVAIQISRMNKGVETLAEGFKDWNSILRKSSKESKEYSDALNGTRSALSDVLGVEEEFIENDFIEQHLDDIKLAAEGNGKAIDRLKQALATDIILNVQGVDKFENLPDKLQNAITNMQSLLDKADLKIGDPGSEDFIAACQEIVKQAGMTAEQAQAYFSQMGFETKFATKQEPVEKTGRGTVTVTEPYGGQTVKMPDGSEIEIPSGYQTKTYPGDPYKFVDYVEVPAMTTDGKTPQIESMTKLAPGSSNNYSQKNSGGPKPGGGGGGGNKGSKVKKTKRSDVVDRYKEITDQLDDIQDATSDASKEMDRLYGSNRLKAIDKQNDLIQKEIGLLKQKRAEAEAYLEVDKQALLAEAKRAGVQLQIGADGNISNYTTVMNGLFDQLAAAENAAGETANEAEQKVIESIQEKIDALKSAISQYDDTREILQELDNSLTEKFYEWQDNNYEKLTYALELKVEINDMELKDLEYYLNKFADNFYKLAESAVLLSDKVPTLEDNLNLQAQVDSQGNLIGGFDYDLTEAYKKGEISQADYIEGLKSSREAIYENLEALIELDKQMLHYYEDTLSMATDELADHTDHLEHLSGVFEHYLNLMDILGKQKDYDSIGDFLLGKADNIRDRLEIAQDYYDMLVEQKRQAEIKLTEAQASGDEARIELAQEEWDAIVDATDQAQEEMLALTEDWAQAMKEVIENNMAKIADTLEKALTNGVGFDSLMDGFDKLNTRQEEYLTKTNQIYETNKLMRTANKALDETDNSVAKQKLKNFIEETKALQQNTKMSEYELEIQKAKYDLLLAEIALEEAQNAKSTIRRSMDNEGNFGYVYTADQDAVDDAEQGVDDAKNRLYNLSLEGQQEYTQKYLQAQQEMYDELTALQQAFLDGEIATEEEYERRKEEILYHYLNPEDGVLTIYSQLFNVAVRTDADATADYWAKDYAKMTQNTAEWNEAVNEYLGDIEEETEKWKEVSEQANDDVKDALDDSSEATDNLREESRDLGNTIRRDVIPAIEREITAVARQTDAYAKQRAELLRLIQAYEQYLRVQGQQIKSASSYDKDKDYAFSAVEKALGGDIEGAYEEVDIRGDKVYAETGKQQDRTRLENIIKWTKTLPEDEKTQALEVMDDLKASGYTGNSIENAMKKFGYNPNITYMKTGGYTGAWGPEGKLAVLHEKELVLNADDTENLLKTVNFVRELVNLIDTQAHTASLLNINAISQVGNTGQSLEQQVSIHAEFPNATDRYEIEEAFNSLVNKASQYANRK